MAFDILSSGQFYRKQMEMRDHRIPYQPRQVVRRASFHHKPSSREHEADFRTFVGNANAHWQGHGNPNAHRTALQSRDNGLTAVLYGQRYSAATISVLTHIFFATLECSLEVCSSAKDAAFAGDNCAFDARVDVDEGESMNKLGHHGVGEGIVLSRAVERQEDYGRGRW
jgi:hypothetical protein